VQSKVGQDAPQKKQPQPFLNRQNSKSKLADPKRLSFSSGVELQRIQKDLLLPMQDACLGKCMFMGPLNIDGNQVTMLDLLPGHIHIAPIVFMDFSMANLTF
jgi:hypothetical protein